MNLTACTTGAVITVIIKSIRKSRIQLKICLVKKTTGKIPQMQFTKMHLGDFMF